MGSSREHAEKDANLILSQETNQFRAGVREGIAQAERGELIEDDEVRKWLDLQER